MKNTIKLSIISIALALGLTQCKKEEINKGHKINAATYELTSLNDCTTSAGTGSSFTLKLIIGILTDVEDLYGIKSKITFSSGTKSENLLRSLSFFPPTKQLSLYRCITFGSSTSATYELQAVSKNGDLGDPIKFTINRPAGAN